MLPNFPNRWKKWLITENTSKLILVDFCTVSFNSIDRGKTKSMSLTTNYTGLKNFILLYELITSANFK